MTPWWEGENVLRGHHHALDPEQIPLDHGQLRHIFFADALVQGVALCMDDVHFGAHESIFEDCRFFQHARKRHPGGRHPQGAFGSGQVVYRRCMFRGLRMISMGGFSLGDARYEHCRFENLRFGWHQSERADLIGCTFTGRIDGGAFYGADHGKLPKINEIFDNDFTQARIATKVEFRTDFPLSLQRWPAGFTPILRADRCTTSNSQS